LMFSSSGDSSADDQVTPHVLQPLVRFSDRHHRIGVFGQGQGKAMIKSSSYAERDVLEPPKEVREGDTSTLAHARQPSRTAAGVSSPRRAQALWRGEGNMQPCGGAKWCAPLLYSSSPCCRSAAGCAACQTR